VVGWVYAQVACARVAQVGVVSRTDAPACCSSRAEWLVSPSGTSCSAPAGSQSSTTGTPTDVMNVGARHAMISRRRAQDLR
jgi:hypothetical protein